MQPHSIGDKGPNNCKLALEKKKKKNTKHVVECEAVLEDYCNCSQINFHVDYNRLLTEK